jgi:uncharacterized membrane protein
MDGLAGCIGAIIAAAFVALTIVLPISTFLRIQRLTKSFEQLRIRVSELEAAARQSPKAVGPASVPTVVPVPTATAGQPSVAPPPQPEIAAEAPAASAVAARAAAAYRVEAEVQPVVPPVPAASARTAGTPVEPQPEPVQSAGSGDTLETRIGSQWFLYIGMAAIVFSVGYFVKYAFDNSWINETTRVVLGVLFGLGAIAAGLRFTRRGYELYGQVVAGGGFVALYVSVWAALNLYGLVSRPAAFVLMVIITAGAALAADGLRSQVLALIAVLGGFLTPALVGGRDDAQVVLLTYVAVLTAGTMLLSTRRGWGWLNRVSYGLTLLTFLGWASVHYTAATYPTTQVFLLLFAAMFGAAFWRERGSAAGNAQSLASFLLGSVIVVFHGASVLNLIDHSLPLLLYLVVFTLAGVAASVKWDRAWLRLAVFLTTVPVFLLWLDTHNTPGWRVAVVVTAVAFYVMHLAAQAERSSRTPADWPQADLALFHGGALALFAALYRVVDAGWPYATSQLAAGLSLWQVLLAWQMRGVSAEGAVNALAAAFAMAGFAIGLYFDDWWALVGWAIEAGAVYWAGLRTGRDWMRWGGGALLLVVVARVLDMNFFGTPAGFEAIWNPRAGATLTIVAATYTMSYFLRRTLGAAEARSSHEYAGLLVGANVLTLLLISAEINSYWHLRTMDDATASFSLMASLSVAWAVYGTALVIVGIQRRYAPLRYLAIALLLLTVAKAFLVDLSALGGIYRIVGFMGLGICLLLGAWLYQRFRGIILGGGSSTAPPTVS